MTAVSGGTNNEWADPVALAEDLADTLALYSQDAREFVQVLASELKPPYPDPDRLVTRTRVRLDSEGQEVTYSLARDHYCSLARDLDIARDIARDIALHPTNNLVRARARARTRGLVRALDKVSFRALALGRSFSFDRDLPLARALPSELTRASARARTVARGWSRVSPGPRDRHSGLST